MLISRVVLPQAAMTGAEQSDWPFTVPAVRQLAAGIELDQAVTFLVGENGSGKSTIVEAVAEAYGLDARGGKAGRKYVNDRPRTPLGEDLQLELTVAGRRMRQAPRNKQHGYFLRAETAFGFMDAISRNGVPGYWSEDVMSMSHGEGFLHVFEEMFQRPGLYLMDEPEAALSFSSCLNLVALMHRLAETGSQVICATHSPILAATPGATILELDEDGIRHSAWEDLALVGHWRGYLADPRRYLRHLIGG